MTEKESQKGVAKLCDLKKAKRLKKSLRPLRIPS